MFSQNCQQFRNCWHFSIFGNWPRNGIPGLGLRWKSVQPNLRAAADPFRNCCHFSIFRNRPRNRLPRLALRWTSVQPNLRVAADPFRNCWHVSIFRNWPRNRNPGLGLRWKTLQPNLRAAADPILPVPAPEKWQNAVSISQNMSKQFGKFKISTNVWNYPWRKVLYFL